MTFDQAFLVVGMYIMVMSFLLLALIKDPNLKSLRKTNNSENLIANAEEEKSFWVKTKNITSLLMR